MDSSIGSEAGQKVRTLLVDSGVSVGLLLALLAVLALDRSQAPPPVEKVAAVDLVFILDQRPAMRDFIEPMKANCLEKAQGLQADGLNCRFAVIPFGTGRKRIAAVPLTGDIAEFERRLKAAPADDDLPAETGVQAIERALRLEFRKDTPSLFFLISRAPWDKAEDVADVARQMEERGITAFIQADKTDRERCAALYRNGGRFFSMEGDDLTGPSEVADKPAENRAVSLLARLAPESKPADPSQLVKAKGIFALRTAPDRQQIIAKLGGTPESETAVQEGLAWLFRHQADDGHWSDEAKCEHGGRCPNIKHGAAVAETALAILAFQAGGHYWFNEQKYSDNVKRGLDWLVTQQKQDGCLFGPVQTWYEHGMATFALAEACAVALASNQTPEPRYLDAAKRAVKFMEQYQYARGGWQYARESPGLGDTSVTGWQMLALKSAMEAKITLEPETLSRLRLFFETCGDPDTGRTGYQSRGGGTDLTTAVGLIHQEFLLKQPESPLALKAVEFLQTRAKELGPRGNFYTLYNGTLAMFLARGEAWDTWNTAVRDSVITRQDKSGCQRGSWNDTYGRTLGTAWAVLTLEVYYRYAAEDLDEDSDPAPSR